MREINTGLMKDKLPVVSPWNKGKRSYTWWDRLNDYLSLKKTKIIVSAELATPIINSEKNSTSLDGILAYAALTNHPVASRYDEAAVIPIPLDLAWVSKNGLPLWACTPLSPVGDTIDTREYWHKRYPTHRADFGMKMNADTTAGRWKEYRVPVNGLYARKLCSIAIGSADEIRSLLENVTHIGKKGSAGYGRVAKWSVVEIEECGFGLQDIIASRPAPVEFYNGKSPEGKIELKRGWTPPYWYMPWWEDCVVPQ